MVLLSFAVHEPGRACRVSGVSLAAAAVGTGPAGMRRRWPGSTSLPMSFTARRSRGLRPNLAGDGLDGVAGLHRVPSGDPHRGGRLGGRARGCCDRRGRGGPHGRNWPRARCALRTWRRDPTAVGWSARSPSACPSRHQAPPAVASGSSEGGRTATPLRRSRPRQPPAPLRRRGRHRHPRARQTSVADWFLRRCQCPRAPGEGPPRRGWRGRTARSAQHPVVPMSISIRGKRGGALFLAVQEALTPAMGIRQAQLLLCRGRQRRGRLDRPAAMVARGRTLSARTPSAARR